MPKIEFEDKFIAFVDVLGFKALVEAAEAGNDAILSRVLDSWGSLGPQNIASDLGRVDRLFVPIAATFEKISTFASRIFRIV